MLHFLHQSLIQRSPLRNSMRKTVATTTTTTTTTSTSTTRTSSSAHDEGKKNRAKRPRWKSEFSSVDDSAHLQALKVPDSGWYGLFFSDPSLLVSSSSSSSSQQPLNATQPAAAAVVAAQLEIAPTVKSQPVCHDLPLCHQGSILNTDKVGMMIYLEADSCVSCSPLQQQDGPVFQWNLQWIRPVTTSDGLQKDGSPLNNGSLSTTSRPFVCFACGRTFSTVKAVHHHVTHAHEDPYQADPLWTTPLQVLQQDNAMAIINKPQGMPVQGSKLTLERSPLLVSSLSPSTAPDVLAKPRAAHRLDSGTGGVLVIAKTKSAEVQLKAAFAHRTCHKRYRALVWGRLEIQTATGNSEKEGCCREPLSGKESITRYRVAQHVSCSRVFQLPNNTEVDSLTVVDLFPETGRQHQLRRHLKFLGHAIVGDTRYGFAMPDEPWTERMCLWAMEITLSHPENPEQQVNCSIQDNPKWLEEVIQQVSRGKELKNELEQPMS